MAFADLTTEEQEALQALTRTLRARTAEFAQLLERFQGLTAYYTGGVDNILAQLLDTDTVPNNTNLDGAQRLTKAEIITIVTAMSTLSATPDGSVGSYNTDSIREIYARACGPINIVN